MEYGVGMMVRSKAGRDKGQWFIVVAIKGDYVYLADGRLRRTENPKKKKIKHVQPDLSIPELLQDKLRAGQPIINEDIKRVLGGKNHVKS